MCHLPHVSHLFRPLLGVVPDMAGSTFPAMRTASGSVHVRKVPEQHRTRLRRRISGNGHRGRRGHEQDTGERCGFRGGL